MRAEATAPRKGAGVGEDVEELNPGLMSVWSTWWVESEHSKAMGRMRLVRGGGGEWGGCQYWDEEYRGLANRLVCIGLVNQVSRPG